MSGRFKPVRRAVVAAMAAMTAVAGCAPPATPHDIAYYRDHGTERATQLAACRNDRGRLAATPNCINALAADSEAASRRFWSTPKPASRVANPSAL